MRAKGPAGYAEWDTALNQPLTVENAAYLSSGRIAKKQNYSALFNRISDAVTGGLDAAGRELDISRGQITAVYTLRRYSSYTARLFFFKKLDFIKECDKANLTKEIVRVAESVIQNVKAAFPDNPDIGFELGILKGVLAKENK